MVPTKKLEGRKEMRWKLGIGLAAAIGSMAASHANAMDIRLVPLGQGDSFIGMSGEIESGDAYRLLEAVQAMPDHRGFLALNSPGGSVGEAERLARLIHISELPVVDGDRAVCASSCFMLFAAGKRKAYIPGAHIGVHSASLGAADSFASLAITTAMARDVANYNVPSSVIGKMVTTSPNEIVWLSESELRAMGAIRLDDAAETSAVPVAPNPGWATSSLDPIPDDRHFVEPSSSFLQGLTDRKSWEGWVLSLSDEARAGAVYWAGQRSLPHPSSCDGRTITFTQACYAAQQKLAAPDVRRKTNPEYRLGWNSY